MKDELKPCPFCGKYKVGIIEKDGNSILYAHDTGYFLDETWEYIEKSNIKFDFVALDCTSILNENAYNNHMGLKACCDVKERLLKKNATESTVFCLHHFSHNGKLMLDQGVINYVKLAHVCYLVFYFHYTTFFALFQYQKQTFQLFYACVCKK